MCNRLHSVVVLKYAKNREITTLEEKISAICLSQ